MQGKPNGKIQITCADCGVIVISVSRIRRYCDECKYKRHAACSKDHKHEYNQKAYEKRKKQEAGAVKVQGQGVRASNVYQVIHDPLDAWGYDSVLGLVDVRNMLEYACFTPKTILKNNGKIYRVEGAVSPAPGVRPDQAQYLVNVRQYERQAV